MYMAAALRVFISEETDPTLNLAIENYLFHSLEREARLLFLWRNSASVVIGRHQNPWVECDLRAMERDGVPLVRRQSGGGAVFHDLGNTNFTFLASSDLYDQDVHFTIVLNALARLGITAELSPRNDILVDGRKVSGNAFKRTKTRSFHHGTLLVAADLDRLTAYLSPRDEGLESRGIKSVRSRVANLSQTAQAELDHESVCSQLTAAFGAYHESTVPVERLVGTTVREHPGVRPYLEQIASWEWRFGNTPDFARRLVGSLLGAEVVVEFDVRHAVIEEARLSIAPELPVDEALASLVQTCAVGARYDSGEVSANIAVARRDASLDSRGWEILGWFLREVR